MPATGRPEPLVSVIVPTFNRAAFLPESIGSVLAQTLDDFEIVVVDDGSTDGTRQIIGAIADERLRYVYQRNAGVSAAMNRGLAEARGCLVARLDSDDLWLPEFLSTQVAALEAHPSAGLVYARGEVMDIAGRASGETWGAPLRYPGETLRSMIWGDATCNITVVARRECFTSAGPYDETLRTSEDWDMWLRVARDWDFVFTDRVLARIRRHDGNLTASTRDGWDEELDRRRLVLDKVFADASLPGLKGLSGLAYGNLYSADALQRFSAGRYRSGFRSAAKAVQVGPRPLWTIARLGWFAFVTPAIHCLPRGRAFAARLSELRRLRIIW